ncbi:uncharacterized protein DS421_20g698140 [Arachis hypogaea]|nr:uncharacterized protein DS421_20g698140 [Arachis hypogaea]
MSDRGKGKVKATSSKRKRYQSSTEPVTSHLSKKHLSEKEKVDQATPPTKSEKFTNLYCELRFSCFGEQKLILENKLVIPSDLRQYIERQIEEMDWAFLDRELARVNESWLQEFYCNFFRATLDSSTVILK